MQPFSGSMRGSHVVDHLTQLRYGPISIDGVFAQLAMRIARTLKSDALTRCLLGNLQGGLELALGLGPSFSAKGRLAGPSPTSLLKNWLGQIDETHRNATEPNSGLRN